MGAFADTAFAKDSAFSSLAFDFGASSPPPPPPPTGPEGGISGFLKAGRMYHGGNLMLEPMAEATARAERIMVGWRDDDEAMLLIQIIETFYD